MPQNITLADLTKSSATPITNPLLNTSQTAPPTPPSSPPPPKPKPPRP